MGQADVKLMWTITCKHAHVQPSSCIVNWSDWQNIQTQVWTPAQKYTMQITTNPACSVNYICLLSYYAAAKQKCELHSVMNPYMLYYYYYMSAADPSSPSLPWQLTV